MKKLYIFSCDQAFNRKIEMSINKGEYSIVLPNITNSMLYSFSINNGLQYVIIHSSFIKGYYQIIDMLLNIKKIVIYVSNNLEYGALYNAMSSPYFHLMDDKYLIAINELLPYMEKNIKYISSLNNELDKLKASVEEERLVKKAKICLMKAYMLSEGEAYKLILKRSMDERVSKAVIAKSNLKEVEK